MDWDTWDHIIFLEREIYYLRSQLQPTDTGHLHTAISVLETHLLLLVAELGYE